MPSWANGTGSAFRFAASFWQRSSMSWRSSSTGPRRRTFASGLPQVWLDKEGALRGKAARHDERVDDRAAALGHDDGIHVDLGDMVALRPREVGERGQAAGKARAVAGRA